MAEDKRNSIDLWAEISKMRDTEGWKILMERYGKEGDDLMTDILNVETPNEPKYGLRDLYVHQLNALGRLSKCITEFETNAKAKDKAQGQPKHIGV